MTPPTPEEQRWHWGEGNKYALEAMKSLLWLNGGSAAALLTFFGNRPRVLTVWFGWALISFSVGAIFAVVLFVVAYATQLNYGNRGVPDLSKDPTNRYHISAYVCLAAALIGFLFGLFCAYCAVEAALPS
jgi:hypothetical protein